MAVFDVRSSLNKVTLDDTQQLTCTIEAAENAQDHTVYLMRVQRGPNAENSWQVWRRYSDFNALHNFLQLSGVDLALPPKKVFGKMEREFVAERQQGLQNYINKVLEIPSLAMSLPVKKFLDPHNYDVNFLELALQHVSMVFRSESQWEVVEPVPDIGWRIRKQHILVKPKSDPKERYLLYWVPFGQDKYLPDKDLQNGMKLLCNAQHHYISPVAYTNTTDNGGVAIRKFYQNGTLKDALCKSKPKEPYLKKYGKMKIPNPVAPEAIRRYGRQILIALKFLHDKGFGHGHLHSGNIIIDGDKAQLLEVENQMLGLPSLLRPFFIQLRKVQTLENIDVYCFGHLLYEMAFGNTCETPTCDYFPPSCPAELRSVMEATLTTEACKNGIPSIANLLQHPFFQAELGVQDVRVSLKIGSQLKEGLRKSKEQMELHLKEEQKIIRHNQRIFKVQAQLNSIEEKKKRSSEKKKQQKQQESSEGVQSESNSSPNSLQNSGSHNSPPPIVASLAPPPPPPPPPMPLALPEKASPALNGSVTAVSSDRSALLGSIQGFNKGKLKRAATQDKSAPTL